MKKLEMELSQDTEHEGNRIKTRQTQSVTIDLNKYPILPGILKIQEVVRVYFLFNWRLITLQLCSSFCHTLT